MDESSQTTSILKLNDPRDFCKKRVIAPNPHVEPWLQWSAALPHEDGAAGHKLTGKSLYSEPLGLAVPPVSGTSYALLVCHNNFP